MKKSVSVILAMTLAAALTGCSSGSQTGETTAASQAETEASQEETKVQETETSQEDAETSSQSEPSQDGSLKIGSLKGPTSMGLVQLMDLSAKGEAEGNYEFTMVTAADELLAQMVSGQLDIALVPANMASIMYNKTEHQVSVIDINTLGVLYIVTADQSIKGIPDLQGKTVYLTGKGTTPDYALQYLLTANGLSADSVTLEYKSEATEVAAVLKEDPNAIGLLPQPFATVALSQNEALKLALDLTAEWDKVAGEEGGSRVCGAIVCRNQVLESNPEAVATFMEEHQASAAYANENTAETAQLVADAGIIEKAPIAEKALPYCSITYIDGEDMKTMLTGYLQVLFDMDPTTVGGAMPEDGFYYIPQE